ncbi:MAG: hypothetical protein Q9164_006774 [Protoblastenia rupestris]
MRLNKLQLFLFPFLVTTTSALLPSKHARATPRSLDAVLVEPQEPAPSPSSSPFIRHIDLRDTTPAAPFLKHLVLRQVAAQPAANAQAQPAGNAQARPVAGAQAQPNTNAQAAPPTVNQAQAAPAPNVAPAPPDPVAPVAGVGGGGAAVPQPPAGATANPVTTINVVTVVGGVTQTIPKAFTQSFGAGESGPPVQSGTIGMGTLTGNIGVVKTNNAKSDAISTTGGRGVGGAIVGILVSWMAIMVVGGGIIGAGMR